MTDIDMGKKYKKRIYITIYFFILILLCSACGKSDSDITHVSKINITGLGITKCQVYSMLYVPEDGLSNFKFKDDNHNMVDDEIINKMLEYKEEGYVGVPASAVAADDIENIIDISNLNSFDFKVLVYVDNYHMYIMTHDLQYYFENKAYADITRDDQFTIDISYYLDDEYGPSHYNMEFNNYTYREFPDRFSYIMSLDKAFLMKCILGFVFRVLAGVIIAVLLGIAFFGEKKILNRIIIVNLILQTIADFFVYYGEGDWKFLYLLPVTVICMSIIEIIVLLRYRKSEIPHFKGKVYAFSFVTNIIVALFSMKVNLILPHLDW